MMTRADEAWRRANPGMSRCVMEADEFFCYYRRMLAFERGD